MGLEEPQILLQNYWWVGVGWGGREAVGASREKMGRDQIGP